MRKNDDSIIGIVGGMGPYAGLDLVTKIFDQTITRNDQGHLPVALLSFPNQIEDRTEFLIGKSEINPAHAISDIIVQLEGIGAKVIGIPCHTMHSPKIFTMVREDLRNKNCNVEIIHMVEAVVEFVTTQHPEIEKLGVLSTSGTYKTGIYPTAFKHTGIDVLSPDENSQLEDFHEAIYDPEFGIKARSNPVTDMARKKLLEAISSLREKGAQLIILGCTELSLAIREKEIGDTIIIDPILILARALINKAYPDKLRPL